MARALATAAIAAALVAATAPPAAAHGTTTLRRVAHCESTHRWHIDTGNGYYGGLQIWATGSRANPGTWERYGGRQFARWPHRATARQQRRVGRRIWKYGWRDREPQGGSAAWGSCWSYAT